MILLEFNNRVIVETLKGRLEQLKEGEKVDGTEITIADFDGTQYHISNMEKDVKEKIFVSISMKCFHQLREHGVEEFLAKKYGNNFVQPPEPGQDATVVVDLANLPADHEAFFVHVSMLRRHCFAALFEKFFSAQKAGNALPGAVVRYRGEESIYLASGKDRVTVIFSTSFSDDDDVVIGKVFLQEFKEGRRANNAAPQVIFKEKEPPQELSDTQALTGNNVCYISFVVEARYFATQAQMDRTIDLVHTFRDYLHYHIKCSKAYLHSRMRSRADNLLKVLNRARPDVEKEKKTAQGKSFVRK